MKRFFGRREGDEIIIEEGELVHMRGVLRFKVGDKFIACIDDENDYYCTLTELGKNKAVAKIEKVERCEALPKKNIVLFFAMPKREYFEPIITQAVELGASEIQPFISHFSVNHAFKRERAEQIILTACKQCERSALVPLNDVISFDKTIGKLKNFDIVIFANEHESKPYNLHELQNHQNIAVIVGCEGGFTQQECDAIIKAGAQSISLGTRILRCTTACVALMSLVSVASGN